MLKRFVSASAVAGIIIACAAVVLVLLTRLYSLSSPYLLCALWCLLPAAWGIWAILAPDKWIPDRLPYWGSILGLLIGLMAAFVLDIPSRIFGLHLSVLWRVLAVLLAIVVYYLLWKVVRALYLRITSLEERIRNIPA